MEKITFSNKVVSAIIIILILVVNAYSLMRFPVAHGDEAWMASRAWEFLQSGNSFGPMDGSVLDRYEGYENFFPWIPTAIQSIGILVIGEPNLLSVRLVSMILGLVLLVAVYWIGVALDGKQLGVLSIALTAFSLPFIFSAHFGRPDIIAVAFGFTSIAIYLNNRSANFWLSILVGLLVALAVEVHPNAVIYAPTIIALFFYRYRWIIFRKPDFWGFVIGGVIGITIYLSMHVLPNPQTFSRLNQILFTVSHTPPLLTADLRVIWNSLTFIVYLILLVFPQIIIGLWAIIRFRRKRPAYISTLLIINGVLILGYLLLIRTKFLIYYAIFFTPGLSLLLAAFFNDLLKSPIKNNFEYRFRILLVAVVCLMPMIPIRNFRQDQNYEQVQSFVNQIIRPDETIMGNQLYWFGLTNQSYNSWQNLVYYQRDNPHSNLEDAFRSLKPDIFILDGHVKDFTFDGASENDYLNQLQISKSELESFLSRYAELVTTSEAGNVGMVQIYRITY